MVAAEQGRTDVIEGMIREMEAGHDIGISRTIHYRNASSATLALNEKHFEIAKRLADLGAPLEANALAIISSKDLLSGPLPHVNAHLNMELLVKSDTLSQGGKVIEHLNNLSSSMKRFSDAYKLGLNSKICRLMGAIQKQEALKCQLEQFGNIIGRIELMSLAGFVSERLVKQFEDQNHLCKDYFEKLQAKTKRIAIIYHETYDYEKLALISSTSLKHGLHEDVVEDVVFDESLLKDEFMQQASQIAQDFGIQIEKVFDLIKSAAIHVESIGSFNDSGILLLGATGTGKSTFLNFMSGCLYQKMKKAGKQMREIFCGNEISETNHGCRAQTRFPIVFNHKKSFSLVDLPGFLDNTENTSIGHISSYDIATALSMNLISKKFKTISGLIACCTESQLTAERPPLELQETFRNVGRIIKGDPELSNNVKLFITKHKDLEPVDVIEGLQQLAIDFNNDEDMCAFLNLFLNGGEEASNRILFTDVINDDNRAVYISELENLKPQETHKFNFKFNSTALIRLQEFVGRLVKLRDELIERIDLLEIEKDIILDDDMNSLLSEHIPQILTHVQDNESIDSLSHEQAVLLEIFSQMTQMNGLLDLLQILELKIVRLNEIKRLIKLLKAKENIENQFIMDCFNLGLYEP
jgi:energy-coupling factor transporter ATP-binding protein EcfA2